MIVRDVENAMIFAFGPFELDAERLLLFFEGQPMALGPKVVETLLALIEHAGEVMSKDALLDRIWPEGYVEEANLAQNIYVLRKAMRALPVAARIPPQRGERRIKSRRRLRARETAPEPLNIHHPSGT